MKIQCKPRAAAWAAYLSYCRPACGACAGGLPLPGSRVAAATGGAGAGARGPAARQPPGGGGGGGAGEGAVGGWRRGTGEGRRRGSCGVARAAAPGGVDGEGVGGRQRWARPQEPGRGTAQPGHSGEAATTGAGGEMARRRRKVIVVIQLEILQAECALIGSPTICEANATQLNGVSCSSSLGNEPCFIQGAQAQQAVNISSCYPGQGWLDSSLPPRADHALSNLPFGGCYGFMPAQNTVAAKMQQLSLNNDHQNQKFDVAMTSQAFGSPGNACGSPLTPSCLLSPPISMDRTHVPSNESPLRITPINALSPYQARWKIKARVTAKSDLRHFINAKGPGKVFSFDLLDAEGGEIRATCFNLQAEQYFDQIEVDKVYLISEGSLKPAQKKFNPLNNDNEIFVDHRTSIEICSSGDGSIPKLRYDFQ
ncbi:replication protein A 70 kDa DNA-binding subunit C-like [Panicum miliaceum]|uniref:Replication protein A 70 kDa DNA-binding subunit C-like n=1 Tax=Panicum miliaceum TaxID=4540 RepID=A0A3L6SSS8_PANMI|nr:replication protein A 70 kDa DNA-binding subunit C-like [Panicum miliaceum]